ncbi:MAG: ArnT family glycosyltransferase, partial [Acidimicrobiales bacterium]
MPDRGNPDAPSRPRSSTPAFVAIVIALLVLATGLRASGLRAGLPYSSYIDEGHYLHPTAHMIANDTYDGGDYQNPYEHPSLPYDAIAVTAELYRLTGDTGIKAGAVATDETPYYDLMQPSELILIGRLVILAFSVGTVLITVLLGTRMIGRRGGLIAGLLVAFLPVLVSRSAIVTADPVVTFFTTASLLAACILARAGASSRRLLGWAALAGALAGMAFTSKYPAGAVVLVALTVIAVRRDLPGATRARLAGATLGAAAVAAVVTMPALVLDTSQVIRDVRYEATVYGRYTDGHYWSWLMDPTQIGWLFTALAVAGVVLLVRNRGTRPTTVGWLVFAVPFATYLVAQRFQPVRNLMPLMPFLAVAVAAAILEAMRRLGRVIPLDRRGREVGAAAATAVVVAALFLGGVRPYLRSSTQVVDSRTEAVDWLEQHVGPDDRVLVVEELAIMPVDLDRIGGHVTVVSVAAGAPKGELAADPPDLAGYDYVVTASFKPGPYAPGTPVWVPPGSGDPAASFGANATVPNPNIWRTSDQIVSIY